jgi:hypothetical protein
MQLWYIHETVSMDAMTASISKAVDNTAMPRLSALRVSQPVRLHTSGVANEHDADRLFRSA